MGAFILSATGRAAVEAVLKHARQPANWYRPGPDVTAPGADPRHVVVLGMYRVVFSWTVAPDGEVFRHLTLSVLWSGRLPNVVVTCTLATLFGFTGGVHRTDGPVPLTLEPGSDWIVGPHQEDACVAVAQVVPPAELITASLREEGETAPTAGGGA